MRIGIHTGTQTVHGCGYVGMDVHRAARIAGAAHGGQIVVSEATAKLVGGVYPAVFSCETSAVISSRTSLTLRVIATSVRRK